MLLLAGDIGGTKTDLGIYSSDDGIHHPLKSEQLPSGEYDSLEDLVSYFLDSVSLKPDVAVFGIAGPVVGEQVDVTNLPWVVDAARLRSGCGFTNVGLLNDLQAVAYAVSFLDENDIETLQSGQENTRGNIGIIAPGTGLGEAFLTWADTGYLAHASEGGHADFAPTQSLEVKLLSYLKAQYEHVSYETVCSGHGIANIYNFLKDSGHAEEPDWLRLELAKRKDPNPIIIADAMKTEATAICRRTVDIFISILAAEAGNLALKLMATGGIYIGGGISPRIISALRSESFVTNFRQKGRFEEWMTQIPIHVILHPKVALLGATCYGMNLIKETVS